MFSELSRPWIFFGAIAALAVISLVWLTVRRSSRDEPWYRQTDLANGSITPASQSEEMEARITLFCGACHAMPAAENFPRDAWHNEVLRGYEFYARSGLTHLDPPPVQATLEYFRSRAPQELVFAAVPEATTPFRAEFTADRWTSGRHAAVPSAIAHLRWARLQTGGRPLLIAADMRSGRVVAVEPGEETDPPNVLARLDNPCHVEPCDLDGDNAIDLVVADLGSSVPYDHDFGRVVWLRRNESRDAFESIVVASALGRVADVRPGDFDGDGDLDLVVAEFGLHRTGQVLLLENISTSDNPPAFARIQIDPRPGSIHVPVVDLNGDGRLDFLALVSQEYECVEAYLNQGSDVSGEGSLGFSRTRLWTGPDLTFGSSGIEPVDIDRDGDLDVLYANGDAFDNNYANPSHGIQWLENVDNQRFAYHRIIDFIGACRALAGDLDLDGDMDIVATAWLPEEVKPADLRDMPLPSVICLEQTEPGVFVRHTLEAGAPRYPALELADFDGDGDLDFAVGSHTADTHRISHWLTIWWNGLKK